MRADIKEMVKVLEQRYSHRPGIGIILGSGLGGLIDEFTDPVKVGFEDIPGFPRSSVKGHSGELVCGLLEGVPLLALSGRVHYYEGYDMDQVTIPIRVMAGLGIKQVIITNAAGAVNPSFQPGDIVAISDHINFMGANPLRGAPDFIDLSEVYSLRLRDIAFEQAGNLGMTLHTGVYTAFSGPTYETPAEVRAVGLLGGDMVGMSTVPEAIMATRLGVEVLGLSTMTNLAAGLSPEPLSHQEVIEISGRTAEKFKALVKAVIAAMANRGA